MFLKPTLHRVVVAQSWRCDRLFPVLLFLLLCTSIPIAANAQQNPATQNRNGEVQSAARTHPLTVPVPQPVSTAAYAASPEQEPASSLEVTFEAGQLMINAQNRTLSEILDAVRARTGAEIDLNGHGSGERMTVRIGPGPARQVLSGLLGWTEFDYIIQGSESDPQAIHSVLLFTRTKTSGVSTASSPAVNSRQPLANTARGAVAPTPTPSNPETVEPETPVAQQQPASEPEAPAAVALDRPATSVNPAFNPAMNGGQGRSGPASVQEMQQMYEQRRQLQQQMNAPGATQKPPSGT